MIGNELRGKVYIVYNHRDMRTIITNRYVLLYVMYRYCQYIVR